MQEVKTFRKYFLDQHFMIKIDHQSIENFLTQKTLSKQQSNSVNELQGFDVAID